MKAIWLCLVGATACSLSIDEGPESNGSVVDAGTSNSSATGTAATVSTSSAVTPQPMVTTTGAVSTAASMTSTTSTTAIATSSNASGSFTNEPTDASVEFTGSTDAGMESDPGSSQNSITSATQSNDSSEELPANEPEPGKLAGITERHNYYREMVNTDPSLPPLVWDPDIALLAQEWAEVLAEDCSFEHSGRMGLGENLATFGASSERGVDNTGPDAVDLWHSEIECYTYGTIAGSSNMGTEECSAECDEYGGCGHYTQVVWRETLRVGCGIASCFRDGFYWDTYVCNYDPPGNFIGEYPY